MQIFGSTVRVHVAVGVTDMRKSFDTLAGLVQEKIGEDPLSGHLFAFCNRGRDRLKVLWWDGGGLCLLAKRLERGRFPWPKSELTDGVVTTTPEDFAELLGWVDAASPTAKAWYDWKSPSAGTAKRSPLSVVRT